MTSMKNFWKDDDLISCAADPIILSVKLNNFRTQRKIHSLIGFAMLVLSVNLPSDLSLDPLRTSLGLFFVVLAALVDIQIKQLRLIQHQQEAKQGDT